MRIGDENGMPDLKQDWDRHALILIKMRIGDENGMPILKQDEDRHALILTRMRIGDENRMPGEEMKMGCLILSKIGIGML